MKTISLKQALEMVTGINMSIKDLNTPNSPAWTACLKIGLRPRLDVIGGIDIFRLDNDLKQLKGEWFREQGYEIA